MIRILSIFAALVLSMAPAFAQDDCPVYETRGWHAWVDRGAEGGGNRLLVFGQVDLPNPGYTISWSEGPLDRMNPPSLRLMLEPVAPDGMALQVIAPTDVMHKLPTQLDVYRSVIIVCGDRQLAEIMDVQLTD